MFLASQGNVLIVSSCSCAYLNLTSAAIESFAALALVAADLIHASSSIEARVGAAFIVFELATITAETCQQYERNSVGING